MTNGMGKDGGLIEAGKASTPMFSVIVPVYNAEDFLEACLDSILAQSCRDFELIIIDDGSTDESGAICDRYLGEHPGVVTVHHIDNGGQYRARALGIAYATGRYACFVDSDDSVVNNWLARIEEAIRKADPDVVIIGFDKSDESGAYVEETIHFFDDGPVAKGELFERWTERPDLNSMCTKVCLRSLYSEKPRIELGPMAIGEDLAQSLPAIMAAETFYSVDEPLYHYRQHPGSVMHGYRHGEHAHIKFEGGLLLDALKEMGFDSPKAVRNIYERCLRSVWKRVSRSMLNESDYKDACGVAAEIRSYEVVQEAKPYVTSLGLSPHAVLGLLLFYRCWDMPLYVYCKGINAVRDRLHR